MGLPGLVAAPGRAEQAGDLGDGRVTAAGGTADAAHRFDLRVQVEDATYGDRARPVLDRATLADLSLPSSWSTRRRQPRV
jgi:hypothetical protein